MCGSWTGFVIVCTCTVCVHSQTYGKKHVLEVEAPGSEEILRRIWHHGRRPHTHNVNDCEEYRASLGPLGSMHTCSKTNMKTYRAQSNMLRK